MNKEKKELFESKKEEICKKVDELKPLIYEWAKELSRPELTEILLLFIQVLIYEVLRKVEPSIEESIIDIKEEVDNEFEKFFKENESKTVGARIIENEITLYKILRVARLVNLENLYIDETLEKIENKLVKIKESSIEEVDTNIIELAKVICFAKKMNVTLDFEKFLEELSENDEDK